MRSRRQYIITKDDVYGRANDWRQNSLRLEYEGTQCTASTLLQVVLIAASRMVNIPWCADANRRRATRPPGVRAIRKKKK